MTFRRVVILFSMAALVAATVLMVAPASSEASAVPAVSAKTMANLMAAYNGESNAHARYLAFAEKAEQDGKGEVASLFRAAARAEEIHASNHATVIKKFGGKPEAKIEDPNVGTTEENLTAAVKGETYEKDVMYPDFIAQAKSERNRDALRTFNYARTAEIEHANLYSNAKKNLATLGDAKTTYYVCTICGYTTTNLDFTKCISCLNPKDKYVPVS
ncbi:MAG: ferritin family protein [Thermoanaerobaculia bacterium]